MCVALIKAKNYSTPFEMAAHACNFIFFNVQSLEPLRVQGIRNGGN